MNNADNLKLAQMGDSEAVEALMEANAPLVHKLSRKFTGRGAELEDLVQIGSIGLLRAIRTFDFSRGTAFSTYAVPLIIGEIRRFLRDDGPMKVSRSQKRAAAILLRCKEDFIKEHGYEPALSELCDICGMDPVEAAAAMDATAPVQSLSDSLTDDGDVTLGDTVQAEDLIERSVELLSLRQSLSRLPPLWRQIVTLRYYKNLSQKETADLLGLTQVKISREEKKIFESLRRELAV
ncbi:MAG: sigma-70 family RNA polymerase sigma factor [Clostridia bacterium]|nr:sigma-70 family RNA polymerase sigma factor [Clostridia bacterium]